MGARNSERELTVQGYPMWLTVPDIVAQQYLRDRC